MGLVKSCRLATEKAVSVTFTTWGGRRYLSNRLSKDRLKPIDWNKILRDLGSNEARREYVTKFPIRDVADCYSEPEGIVNSKIALLFMIVVRIRKTLLDLLPWQTKAVTANQMKLKILLMISLICL